MRKATRSDKSLVVEIMFSSFETNPGVNWMLKKGGNHSRKIRRLSVYAFYKALARNGVFISEDGKGVALCYQYNLKKFSLPAIWSEFWFGITSIRLIDIPVVLRREAYKKSKRPAAGEYLYFWFLGVLPGARGSVFELGWSVVDEAKRLNMPIYLETAMERNKAAYERYGCKTYHFWEHPKRNIRFWFMKREADATNPGT